MERKPRFGAPAEIGLQEACQVKNSAGGRVNEQKLRDLPWGLMLRNAPIWTLYRTAIVRFFRDSRARKVVSPRILKNPRRKKSAPAENNICFSPLNACTAFFLGFSVENCTEWHVFCKTLAETYWNSPASQAGTQPPTKSNESPYAKYIFS